MPRPGFKLVTCSRCPRMYHFGGPYTEDVCPSCYPVARGFARTPEQQARLERDRAALTGRATEPDQEERLETAAA